MAVFNTFFQIGAALGLGLFLFGVFPLVLILKKRGR